MNSSKAAELIQELKRDRDEAVELLSLLWGRRLAGEEPADWVSNAGKKTELCRRVQSLLERNGFEVVVKYPARGN